MVTKNRKVILVTGHRRENFGKKFENICSAILDIANSEDVQIIFPVHLNPNIKEVVHKALGNHPRIYLCEPLNYPAFIWVMNAAYIILTDSGGVQEEAPSVGVPVLVMRNNTERPEGVMAKTALLVGSDKKKIILNVKNLIDDKKLYKKMSETQNPYGDGLASKKIVEYLKEHSK